MVPNFISTQSSIINLNLIEFRIRIVIIVKVALAKVARRSNDISRDDTCDPRSSYGSIQIHTGVSSGQSDCNVSPTTIGDLNRRHSSVSQRSIDAKIDHGKVRVDVIRYSHVVDELAIGAVD